VELIMKIDKMEIESPLIENLRLERRSIIITRIYVVVVCLLTMALALAIMWGAP